MVGDFAVAAELAKVVSDAHIFALGETSEANEESLNDFLSTNLDFHGVGRSHKTCSDAFMEMEDTTNVMDHEEHRLRITSLLFVLATLLWGTPPGLLCGWMSPLVRDIIRTFI